MARRPTAAGLAASLGLAPAAEPEAVMDSVPVAPKRHRMSGVVPPAIPIPEPAVEATGAASTPPARREPPSTSRPVLRRLPDGSEHPVPPDWLDERGMRHDGWYLTYDEQAVLAAEAPADAIDVAQWPGCMSQIHPLHTLSYDPESPYDAWTSGVLKRRKLRGLMK